MESMIANMDVSIIGRQCNKIAGYCLKGIVALIQASSLMLLSEIIVVYPKNYVKCIPQLRL